jgi:concanavalin A-like lectin/glucanase superfamily protein
MSADPRADGSYVVMGLDALSWAQTSANLGIAFDGSTPLSVDAWIRFNGLPASTAALSKQGVFSFGSQGPAVAFEFVGLGTVVSDPGQGSLRDDTWHFVCATFDGSMIRLYLDGVFNTGQSVSGTGGSSASPILIGPGVQGLVRRVRVYNQSLTGETVLANMFLRPVAGTVVADFDFSVVPPVDRGPGRNPISLQNNAAMIKVSPALSLGSEGFARPFGDRAINPGGAQVDPYSVQSWVYVLPSTNAQQAILVNSDLLSDTGIALFLQYDATAGQYRLVSQRGSGTDPAQVLISNGVVASGVWTNVATTFDGLRLSLYVNGALDSSKSCAPIPLYRAQSDLLIGAALAQGIPAGATTFQGFIREVDVWNRAITAAEVLANLNALPNLTDASLVGAYNFTSSPARNQANGHPIGLAEGAVLSGQLGPAPPSTRATDAPEAALPPAGLDEKTLAEFRATLDIPRALAECGPDLERSMQADIAEFSDPKDRERVRSAWADALRRMKEEPETMPLWVTQHRHNGEHLLVCHTPRGSYVAFRAPEGTVDDCTLWKIKLVFIVVAGALDAFTGVGARLTNEAITYIGRILANARIAALLSQGTAIRAATIFTIIGLLYSGGFLRPLVIMLLEVGFWTLVRVVARMLLVAAGVGAAAVIASLAATVATFAVAYLNRPGSCDPLPTVDLSTITFNYDPLGRAVDGLAIRRNFANDISLPEWRKGLILASDSPAAYAITRVTGRVVTIQAVFTISGPAASAVQIRALGGGILGAIDPVTVVFGAGNTATVTLNLDHHQLAASGVQAQNVAFTWQYQIGSSAWTTIGISNHRIYVLLARPMSPWVQGANPAEKQLPWTDLLDYACLWAYGTTTPDAAIQAITRRVNRSLNLTYDDPGGGRTFYTDNAMPNNFLATEFIDFLKTGGGRGNRVNCTDCATIVTSLVNILGTNVFASTMSDTPLPGTHGFACNKILAIGTTTNWAVPFGRGFSYHEVVWTGGGSSLTDKIYDACLQVDTSSNPWNPTTPVGGLALNWIFAKVGAVVPIQPPYTDMTYRERLATNAPAGIPMCIPQGQWPDANSGRRPAL